MACLSHCLLRTSPTKPPTLYCNNLCEIEIDSNLVFHESNKLRKIDCQLVCEKVQNGLFKLLSVPSKDQVANFFIKPLLPQYFHTLISKLGMITIYPLTYGWISHNNNHSQVS